MSNSQQARADRIGGLVLHSRNDSATIAARARRGLEAKFRREVVAAATEAGQGDLSEEETSRRVAISRRVFFVRLSQRSAQVRRTRAA